jgi:ATP-grasp domain
LTTTPNILLATTCAWPSAARLAIAFSNFGCRVEVLGPGGQLASKTSAVVRTTTYNPLAPLSSFRRALERPEQDLVVPCDDLAAKHLHELYSEEVRSGRPLSPLAGLLKRSLGDPTAIALVAARGSLIDIARVEKISVPETASLGALGELHNWIDKNGLPAVVKADGTAAGKGVRVVRTRREAELAFLNLKSPPVALWVAKRALIDGDLTQILPFLSRTKSFLCAQRFIPGRDATASIACWEGRLVANINCEVLKVVKPNGPASVVRLIENPQMSEAAAKLARRLNLSGLYGLDFKIDHLGIAYLIEMNPRATQSSHLRLGPSRDLVGALVGAMRREPIDEVKNAPTASPVIALFPNEWQSDPASAFLGTAYHDVPWSEPELVRACMRKRSPVGKWFSSGNWPEIRSRVDWTCDSSIVSAPLEEHSQSYSVVSPGTALSGKES